MAVGQSAIFTTRRRTATVTTTAPTTVFAMFGADFAKLVATSPRCTRRSTKRSRHACPGSYTFS